MSAVPTGFAPGPGDAVLVHLGPEDRAVLAGLLEQLADLVRPEDVEDGDPLAALVGIDGDGIAPRDPALARLFPDAYRDDDESAAEFRRYTERGLRSAKVENATTARRCLQRDGDPLALTADEARAFLGALNDLRLTLGARLGIQDDEHDLADLPEDDPAFAASHVYDWLTWLQESLVQALVGRRGRRT